MTFGRKRGDDKLYKQWVKHGDLPVETIPRRENSREVSVGRGKNNRGLRLLYILLGVSILVLCVGLALLLTQSC